MNVVYSEKAKQAREEYPLLQQASRRLPDIIIGADARNVTAEWDRAEGKDGQPLFTLKLKDLFDEASDTFDLEELQSPEGLDLGLRHVWSKVLQAGTHRLLRERETRVAGE